MPSKKQKEACARMVQSRMKRGIHNMAQEVAHEANNTTGYITLHLLGEMSAGGFVSMANEYLRPDRGIYIERGVLKFRNDVDSRIGILPIRSAHPSVLVALCFDVFEDTFAGRLSESINRLMGGSKEDWTSKVIAKMRRWDWRRDAKESSSRMAVKYLRGPIGLDLRTYCAQFSSLWRDKAKSMWRRQSPPVESRVTIDSYYLVRNTW